MASAPELTENAKKLLDDKNICGFCTLQVLDPDGIPYKTNGHKIEAPFHVVSGADDKVVLESTFAWNPVFNLALHSDDSWLFGRWWIGEANWSRTNQLASVVPKSRSAIDKELKDDAFTAEAEMPFIKDGGKRLLPVKLTTVERRLKRTVASANLEIPRDAWDEYKQYRLKLWRQGKMWSASDKKEKKDDKKDEE